VDRKRRCSVKRVAAIGMLLLALGGCLFTSDDDQVLIPVIGWAIGWDETGTAVIFHTGNGGTTWEVQGDRTLWTGHSGNDISAVNGRTAWAALGTPDGGHGIILHTTNGGATWVVQALPPGVDDSVKCIKGLSESVAWAVTLKGTILRTEDGGQTWNVVPHPGIPIGEVNRMDAVGFRDVWVVDHLGGATGVIHTTDNGATWRQETLPDILGQGPLAISAFSTDVVWSAVNMEGDLFRTVDGGTTWTKAATGLSALNDFDDICATGADTIWAVLNLSGNSGGTIFFVRVTGGQMSFDTFRPAISYQYEGVTCLDEKTCWVVGLKTIGADPSLPKAVILHTRDGTNWVSQPVPVNNAELWKVSFVNARR
jgi:photosystem II stability/assembly factor-like uncharacterized protein